MGIVCEYTNDPFREQAGSVGTDTLAHRVIYSKYPVNTHGKQSTFKVCAELRVLGNCPMCVFSESLGFGLQHGRTSP